MHTPLLLYQDFITYEMLKARTATTQGYKQLCINDEQKV